MYLSNAALYTPTDVDASSTLGTYTKYALINNWGLSTPVSETSIHDGNYRNMWLSGGGDAHGWLTFDLGSVQLVGSALVWQYNHDVNATLERSLKLFDIQASNNGSVWTTVRSDAFLTSRLTDPSATSAQTIFFNNQVSTRYLRFDLKENWGAENYTGLSEVKFSNTIPEPSTVSLLGLSAVSGVMLRRRRNKIGPKKAPPSSDRFMEQW